MPVFLHPAPEVDGGRGRLGLGLVDPLWPVVVVILDVQAERQVCLVVRSVRAAGAEGPRQASPSGPDPDPFLVVRLLQGVERGRPSPDERRLIPGNVRYFRKARVPGAGSVRHRPVESQGLPAGFRG